MTFELLDRLITTGAPHLSDDDFGRLVDTWIAAAGRIISAPATNGRDVATKLPAFARVLDELHGSVIGEREIGMARVILADVERFAE
jgi:hypothetical protein